MTWASVWICIKDIPAKVWLGVLWALCLVGWWLTRSELAREKAKSIRLEHKAKQKAARQASVIRLQQRKARIQAELVKAKEKAQEKNTEIAKMDTDELAKALNDEFID